MSRTYSFICHFNPLQLSTFEAERMNTLEHEHVTLFAGASACDPTSITDDGYDAPATFQIERLSHEPANCAPHLNVAYHSWIMGSEIE